MQHSPGFLLVLSWLAASSGLRAQAPTPTPIPVTIRVDADHPTGPLPRIWRFFGADEPNYATMRDGKKLLGELGALAPGETFFRTHNLLCTGDGTPALKWGSTNVYTEDAEGRPVYDWHIVDEIFDTYLQRGVRPYAQIGFMPRALSTHPEPYQHHWTPRARYEEIMTGWSYPPTDYAKWGELAYQWTKHCVERYGAEEVSRWYWEVWNEANGLYWHGSHDDFNKLHDYAVAGVRRALPNARVGGPDAAGSGGRFTEDFLNHCLHGTNFATGEPGTPLDFVAFHAKGAPEFVDGHVRLGIAAQLRTLDEGFRLVARHPELRRTPVIIGESDPDGCAACQGPQLGYRNGTMYSSYTAASFARHLDLAERAGVNLEGALTWAFEFEDQPPFAGFRVLASQGVDLPVLNVFRLFSRLGGLRLPVESTGAVPLGQLLKSGVRGPADVSALASLDQDRLCMLVWHYHDDDLPGPAAEVEISLDGLPEGLAGGRLRQYLIDHDHSNAYTVWQNLGAPAKPDSAQMALLEQAGQLAEVEVPEGALKTSDARHATLHLSLPRQGVALFVLGR